VLTVALLSYLVFGAAYSSGLISYGFEWIPPNMVQSSIAIHKIDDCITCVRWLEKNAESGGCILVEERFSGWVQMYMTREDVKLILYAAPATEPIGRFEWRLQWALDNGLNPIYLIWYSNSEIENFEPVFVCGDIAIYMYRS